MRVGAHGKSWHGRMKGIRMGLERIIVYTQGWAPATRAAERGTKHQGIRGVPAGIT